MLAFLSGHSQNPFLPAEARMQGFLTYLALKGRKHERELCEIMWNHARLAAIWGLSRLLVHLLYACGLRVCETALPANQCLHF